MVADEIFLRRIYSVNLKCDLKPKEVLQEILELRHPRVFLISPLHGVFLSVCLHQWLQVNALQMCWDVLRIINCNYGTRSFPWFHHAPYQLWSCTRARFFSIINAFSEEKGRKVLLNKMFNLFWKVLTMVWCISKSLAFGFHPSSDVFSLKTTFQKLALLPSSGKKGGKAWNLLCGVP
jgi:hypothetical protein